MSVKMYIFFIVIILCNFGAGLAKDETKQEKEANSQTPALNPEERYQDLFPLTNDNFTRNVLRNKDVWIVIFHDGFVEREWKTMATHLRGLCWFGLIDVNTETDLLSAIEYDASQGQARFYPPGDRKTKENKWRGVRDQNEARTHVLTSLPDKTIRISGDGFKDLLLESFTSQPSRFPSILILDEDDTPPVFKAIAKRFEKYFLFGRLVRPSSVDLRAVGLQNMYLNPPELFVMVTENNTPEKIDAIKFDKDKFGNMNYTTILQFLFAINGQFRYDLPGYNMAESQEQAEMSDIIRIEEKRFEIHRDIKGKPNGPVEDNGNTGLEVNEGIKWKVKDEL